MALFKFTLFPSVAALQQETVKCLGEILQGTGGGAFAVMLSGGRTPLDIYRILQEQELRPSDSTHILYSDERDVPENSEENNYHHTKVLLRSLGIPDSKVMRVHTGQPLELAANQYHEELQQFIAGGGRIPLGLLGIGPDGHTASLFSPEDVARGHGRLAVAIPREPKPDRISVTPSLLAQVGRIIILAVGPEKHAVIAKLLKRPQDVVAGLALRNAPQVEIWQA